MLRGAGKKKELINSSGSYIDVSQLFATQVF
jgi:hypothetical protein